MMDPAAGQRSREMLRRLRRVLAGAGDGQSRIDSVVETIADAMAAEVCSIYLKIDDERLELCATEGLRKSAVHRTRLRLGQGLVGLIAQRAAAFSTDDAPSAPGFQYLPEVGEDVYRSFAGVPIQRFGDVLGVLVVQNADPRRYTEDEIDALEITAMVIAEMTESGQLAGVADRAAAQRGFHGAAASEGTVIGLAHLFDPRLAIAQPFTDEIEAERARLDAAMTGLRDEVDQMLDHPLAAKGGEYRDVMEAYRLFAHDKGWSRRLHEAVASGVVAEVAVERVQSEARARMERAADPYLRDRLHDLDDLANRLLRRLTGGDAGAVPEGAILIARQIGPGELLERAGTLGGVVLEEGGVGGHAAIVARALGVPMVVGAERLLSHAREGDEMIVDGDIGAVFLSPDESTLETYRAKSLAAEAARAIYREARHLPAETRDGRRVALSINAGLSSDLSQLEETGAVGVGLYRTELQFLIRPRMPTRGELAAIYGRVLDAANGAPVAFRTLDIGSDKVLPYLKRPHEDNPALGWRALRVGLDKPMMLRAQLQALMRGAAGRPLSIMFPFVTEEAEFYAARDHALRTRDHLAARGHAAPEALRLGAMLETPSIAYASDRFFRTADFISIGGNDLMQFFFAADRGNEMVRGRYGFFSPAFLRFLAEVQRRCEGCEVPLSFCGESAGRPVEAVALAALGFRALSMRPSSVGPVKAALRGVDLTEVSGVLDPLLAGEGGADEIRARLSALIRK